MSRAAGACAARSIEYVIRERDRFDLSGSPDYHERGLTRASVSRILGSMKMRPKWMLAIGVALFSTCLLARAMAIENNVEVRAIKYEQLAAAVNSLKGKVVVIDFWAHW